MTEDEKANLEIDIAARAEFQLQVIACLSAAVEMEKVDHADSNTEWGNTHEMLVANVVQTAIDLATAVDEMTPRFWRRRTEP